MDGESGKEEITDEKKDLFVSFNFFYIFLSLFEPQTKKWLIFFLIWYILISIPFTFTFIVHDFLLFLFI